MACPDSLQQRLMVRILSFNVSLAVRFSGLVFGSIIAIESWRSDFAEKQIAVVV